MSKYKVSVDQVTCIGCAACTASCPRFFEMHDTPDGDKARTKESEADELEPVMEAAEVCPVNAIHIDKGEKRLI